MNKELYKQAAYHESGHVVMAYLTGFKSDFTELILEDPGSGRTKFDYGDQRITLIIAAMQNYISDPSIYNGLPNNLKSVCCQLAFKICGTLMGGPVGETFFKEGIDFKGQLPIEMSGPDLISVNNIHACLMNNIQGHNPDYIRESLINVTEMIQQAETWKAIEHLATKILDSPKKHLDREEIELSLKESGYLEYIDKF